MLRLRIREQNVQDLVAITESVCIWQTAKFYNLILGNCIRKTMRNHKQVLFHPKSLLGFPDKGDLVFIYF